ncbi:MAG: DUF2752 domain-containing protein [Oscillospiraceae bacterium]|nr:DUF2752 domain-containing protein [Oscillospiraceae bacterium]
MNIARTEITHGDPEVARRRKQVLQHALAIAVVGALYAGFVQLTGWGIPCPFRLVTGLRCPGCGVTHMCMSLLHLDLRGAFAANAAILCLLPLLAFTALRQIWLYIHRGVSRSTVTDVVSGFSIVVLLAFGVVRNLI